MYDISNYYQAKDAADAVRALGEDGTAVVISGGTDVLIQVREGKLAGASLVSVHGLPELLALAVTGVIHGWKRNSLLSIGCGTLFYMVLVQQIFR